MFSSSAVGARAAAAIMFIIGVLFGVAAAINMIILLKVVFGITLVVLIILPTIKRVFHCAVNHD